MAKGKSKRHLPRDTTQVANVKLRQMPLTVIDPFSLDFSTPVMSQARISRPVDRRVFNPTRKVLTATGRNPFPIHFWLGRQPIDQKTMVCVRRKVRREVLLAKGYGGRNRLRRGPMKFVSKLRCK